MQFVLFLLSFIQLLAAFPVLPPVVGPIARPIARQLKTSLTASSLEGLDKAAEKIASSLDLNFFPSLAAKKPAPMTSAAGNLYNKPTHSIDVGSFLDPVAIKPKMALPKSSPSLAKPLNDIELAADKIVSTLDLRFLPKF